MNKFLVHKPLSFCKPISVTLLDRGRVFAFFRRDRASERCEASGSECEPGVSLPLA